MNDRTTPDTRLGSVTWHSSDGEAPDCGLSLGLGEGRVFYVGELANATLAEMGIETKRHGDGWWIAILGAKATDTEIAGKVVDADAARALFDALTVALGRGALQ